MAKLPPPPAALVEPHDTELRSLGAGTLVWRVYFAGGDHPSTWNRFRFYGPVATGRFDHHDLPPREQGRGIMYVALDGPTCIAEVFQDTRVIDRTARKPWLAAFRLSRPLVVLDLTTHWPTRAGASQAISSGRRDRAREWARAIYDQFDFDGLYYRSAMSAEGLNLAIAEQAEDSIPMKPELHMPLEHPGLDVILQNAARSFGYLMV